MDKVTTIISVGDVASGGSGGTGENTSLCPSLSFKNRMMGCLACLGLGLLFGILSWVTVFLGDYAFFGVLFTLASLCCIGSTLFLAGPMKQLKSMFSEGRWIATVVYFVAMILTILAAVLLKSGIATIFMCLIQFGAMAWYVLSYIPFARDAIKSAISGCIRG